jgi:hypothetical protein
MVSVTSGFTGMRLPTQFGLLVVVKYGGPSGQSLDSLCTTLLVTLSRWPSIWIMVFQENATCVCAFFAQCCQRHEELSTSHRLKKE